MANTFNLTTAALLAVLDQDKCNDPSLYASVYFGKSLTALSFKERTYGLMLLRQGLSRDNVP